MDDNNCHHYQQQQQLEERIHDSANQHHNSSTFPFTSLFSSFNNRYFIQNSNNFGSNFNTTTTKIPNYYSFHPIISFLFSNSFYQQKNYKPLCGNINQYFLDVYLFIILFIVYCSVFDDTILLMLLLLLFAQFNFNSTFTFHLDIINENKKMVAEKRYFHTNSYMI